MAYKSPLGAMFRNKFAEDIFVQKYRHEGCETWEDLCGTLVEDVCRDKMSVSEKEQLKDFMSRGLCIAGGRYLSYAGRARKFFSNCFMLKAETDTREDWAELSKKAELCLSTGGGIGIDYSIYRARNSVLHGTGGVASGPVSKMLMINEIGRQIIQGGSRRSAIYASLNWKHPDSTEFLQSKDWNKLKIAGTELSYADVKKIDFNFPCPLDGTNISLNYDTNWLLEYWRTGDVGETFRNNIKQALKTSEPGFSFNFFEHENETLRNACCELVSEDDSDVCNLLSINLGRIDSLSELGDVTNLCTKFLICGTLVSHLPYEKVHQVREKNRRLGLGLMGIHEWLLKRGKSYEVDYELTRWYQIYQSVSDATSKHFANKLSISIPVGNRAIAPTGSLSILASTTGGIEPLYAVSYKRRYLNNGLWQYQYVVDSTAKNLIELYGIDPITIETAKELSLDYERRMKFQAKTQEYVDHAISSTINIPEWGTEHNNEDTVSGFTETLAKYAHRLRGFTVYSENSRGGQPLTSVPYEEAVSKEGEVFVETTDVCDITGRGGVCGS